MRMFGIVTVQRDGHDVPVQTSVHGAAEVTTRSELFQELLAVLPGKWLGTDFRVIFFYAEPDSVVEG